MRTKEIEIKIKLDDMAALIKKAESLGGKKIYEGLEHDVMYDDGKGFFDAQRVLRLRKSSGKGNLLTYKEREEGDKHEHILKRTEVETLVDDYEAMDGILRKLGFVPYRIKEKIESQYELDKYVLQFQKLPFLGDFLEIEADEEKLPQILSKLGLSMEQGINKDFTSLFMEYCAERELSPDTPQTFEEEQKRGNGQT